MKIISFDVFRYSLPLQLPLLFEGKPLLNRDGLLIVIGGDSHATGVGEIAPLPGFSEERLQEAQRQALDLKNALLNKRIPEGVEKLTWHFETWLRPFRLFPSVRSGLEMAILNLLANSEEQPLCEFLGASNKSKAQYSALLSGTQKQVTREIKRYIGWGVRSFKLKIGSDDIFDDLEKIAIVRNLIPRNTDLRLDANQLWDYGQASSFAKEMDKSYVEYLEEPTKDNLMLNDFYKVTKFPFALDESLRSLPLETIKELKGIKAFVLKPTMLGGFEKTLGWVRLAKEMGIDAVISSSFETGVGLRGLAHLACAATPEMPAGLDTLKWFEHDLYPEPLYVTDGKITRESMELEKTRIDFEHLEPVNP